MTPVEERIDHELRRFFEPASGFVDWALADGDNNAEWVTPRHAGRLMVKRLRALLTEHSAREELEVAVEWLINGSWVFVERESRYTVEDLLAAYRERFIPATESAQPEEER